MNEFYRNKVLLVDDNPLNMKLALDLLEVNGYEVYTADDGELALQILDKYCPNLVLLDIQLPGISGYDVFAKIREQKSFDNVKVVAFTAQAMKEDEMKIKKLGFDSYITKPIDTRAFIKTVAEIIAQKD